MAQKAQTHKAYKGADRGEEEELQRKQAPYIKVANKNTELFIDTDADTILSLLVEAGNKDLSVKCEVSKTTYKVKMTKDIKIKQEDGKVLLETLKMTVNILKVDDKTNCLEFTKSEGNAMYFLQ